MSSLQIRDYKVGTYFILFDRDSFPVISSFVKKKQGVHLGVYNQEPHLLEKLRFLLSLLAEVLQKRETSCKAQKQHPKSNVSKFRKYWIKILHFYISIETNDHLSPIQMGLNASKNNRTAKSLDSLQSLFHHL